MTPYTQSNVSPGNCWQTVVASLLDVDPVMLPDQVAIETAEKSYHNALNVYLRKHHGLLYTQIEAFKMVTLALREPGWHGLIGKTVRTPVTKALHVVVARHGEMLWDPHPSRAGLTLVMQWGILIPFPDEYRESWDSMGMNVCECPSCSAGD